MYTFEYGTIWASFTQGHVGTICTLSIPAVESRDGLGATVQEAFAAAKARLLAVARQQKATLDAQVQELEAL